MESVNTWIFIAVITAIAIFLSTRSEGWKVAAIKSGYMFLLGVPVMIIYNIGDTLLRYLPLFLFMLGFYVLNKLIARERD